MRRLVFILLTAAACGTPDSPSPMGDDLPLGDRFDDDLKADGNWGAALTCKPLPMLPQLVSPRITISIDGLSVHVVDPATGYDKVFPAGVGAIELDDTKTAYRESHSYEPVLFSGVQDFTLRLANVQPCKTWWTDPETGVKQPVFAGLPFMPFYGGYALHGPIDGFRAPSGGSLRRGYVSHGCIRMRSEDVLELYARIRSLRSVPVHLQREPERTAAGRRVDVPSPWIGAECASDSECAFTGGFCKQNRFSQRGFCSARCTRTCADRAGEPTTFCVADPDDATKGMCVSKVSAVSFECRPGDHLVPATRGRFGQPTVTASVCLPGSRGWVGDRCLAASDCTTGTTCTSGLCTMACTRFCADQPGFTDTFCANDARLGATCLRQCTPASNAAECPAGTRCEERARPNDPTRKFVCIPL